VLRCGRSIQRLRIHVQIRRPLAALASIRYANHWLCSTLSLACSGSAQSRREIYCRNYLRLNRIYDGLVSHFPASAGDGDSCTHHDNVTNVVTFSLVCRIVRNKAAEKAKHVHHQQQSQNSGTPPGDLKALEPPRGAIDTVRLPFAGLLPQSPQMTTTDPQDSNGGNSGPNSLNGTEGRISSGYSINGILGIQHSNDPNVNTMKRKRVDDHGEFEKRPEVACISRSCPGQEDGRDGMKGRADEKHEISFRRAKTFCHCLSLSALCSIENFFIVVCCNGASSSHSSAFIALVFMHRKGKAGVLFVLLSDPSTLAAENVIAQ
jgi:hypothetical protein